MENSWKHQQRDIFKTGPADILSWTNSCLEGKKSIKNSGNDVHYMHTTTSMFLTLLNVLCLTFLSDPIGVLLGLLWSLVWTLMNSHWGQSSWEWRVNTVWVNLNEKLLEKWWWWEGKVDWTPMLFFSTHYTHSHQRDDLTLYPFTTNFVYHFEDLNDLQLLCDCHLNVRGVVCDRNIIWIPKFLHIRSLLLSLSYIHCTRVCLCQCFIRRDIHIHTLLLPSSPTSLLLSAPAIRLILFSPATGLFSLYSLTHSKDWVQASDPVILRNRHPIADTSVTPAFLITLGTAVKIWVIKKFGKHTHKKSAHSFSLSQTSCRIQVVSLCITYLFCVYINTIR